MTQVETGPFASWTKPAWDEMFMGIAYITAMMSPDHNTKHGAVIVDCHKRVVSVGFNGYPPGCRDAEMPKIRPAKYLATEHAECNALNNALCDVEGMTLYVTGHCCAPCFRTIRCRRISTVIYDPTIDTACVTEDHIEMIKLMNQKPNYLSEDCGKPYLSNHIELVPFIGNFATCMDRAKEYYRIKQELKAKNS